MQIFDKPLIFYLKPEFHWKYLKCVFKAFYSDQAFRDFLDTCSNFSAVCKKKRFVNKSLEFLRKRMLQKNQLMT
jgi:hypothetical protein